MPRIHSHVPDDNSSFGSVGQRLAFDNAVRLYSKDRLEDAFKAMVELGTGALGEAIPTYRMIEAEYLTRQRAKTVVLSPLLRIEYVPGAVDEGLLVQTIQQALNETGSRLGLVWDSIVHATILDETANAPWAPGRHGYCSPKDGFAKVCLPHYLTFNPNELASAFRHELAHALVFQETELSCATWLNEACAMQMGGEPLEWHRPDRFVWRGPIELDIAFKHPRISPEEQRDAQAAYYQAALIGAFIADSFGESKLGSLLKAHRLGFVDQLKLSALGIGATELAAQRIFGMSVGDLFGRASVGTKA